MITLAHIKAHIRKCKHENRRYNWLGFVENKDLSPNVEALFVVGFLHGWDWVNGNDKMKELEENTK